MCAMSETIENLKNRKQQQQQKLVSEVPSDSKF